MALSVSLRSSSRRESVSSTVDCMEVIFFSCSMCFSNDLMLSVWSVVLSWMRSLCMFFSEFVIHVRSSSVFVSMH